MSSGSAVEESLRRLGRGPIALVFLLMALAIAYKTYKVAQKPGTGIEIENLVVANDIYRGIRSQPGIERDKHERMPGYALLLAAVASIDRSLATGLGCRDFRDESCGKRHFAGIVVVQYLAAIATLGIALALAWRLSGSAVIAGLALVLTYLGTRPGDFAGMISWNVWHQMLLSLGALASLVAHQRLSLAWGMLAGVAFAACGVLEPHVMLLLPVVAAVIALAGAKGRPGLQRLAVACAVLGGGLVAVLCLSWLALRLSYNPEAPLRYLLFRTAERLDYNGLDPRSWVVGLLLPIPLIGDALQGYILPEEIARRFGMYSAGSLAHQSLVTTYPAYLRDGGNATGGLGLLLRVRLMEQPGAYLAALPPVFFRGFWASAGLVALLGMLHLRVMVRYARVERQAADLAVVAIPILALLVINTLLTPNHYFLNPMLPFLFAYAISYVSGGL